MILDDAECLLQLKNWDGKVDYTPKMMRNNQFYGNANTLVGQLKANECLNDYNNMYSACMTPNGNLEVSIKNNVAGAATLTYDTDTFCELPGACVVQLKGSILEIFDIYNNK